MVDVDGWRELVFQLMFIVLMQRDRIGGDGLNRAIGAMGSRDCVRPALGWGIQVRKKAAWDAK
jgi:hypothetical protein